MAIFAEVTPGAQSLRDVYSGQRVLVTGHTGFKGSWLTLWLDSLGAKVTGYAMPPEEGRSLFRMAGVESRCAHIEGDVRSFERLERLIRDLRPRFVFHLAAQSLVRRSYRAPLETFETNAGGTANLLEAIRRTEGPCAVVIVTSDKCYENDGRTSPYSESDPLGGRDPYSASKGAAEIIASSYRSSFFPPERLAGQGVAVATARSGNVIGGGDWCEDRLVPDAVRALEAGVPIPVRNPRSVRPWQHVLEPLSGYLMLGAHLASSNPEEYCGAWNFGPNSTDFRCVSDVVDEVIRYWGTGSWIDASDPTAPHEAAHLTLSIEKAKTRLGWSPRWSLSKTVSRTVAWYRCAGSGSTPDRFADLCRAQIAEHST